MQEHDDGDPTPTEAPSRPKGPETTASSASNRAHLQRTPPGRLSEINRSPDEAAREESVQIDTTATLASHDGAAEEHRKSTRPSAPRSGSSHKGKSKSGPPAAQHGNLDQIKDQLGAKMLAQTRMRRSYGSSSAGAKGEGKRVSPIREEEGSSEGSLNALLGDDAAIRTSSTVSTESTESNRTIRGSVAGTPAAAPLRTPSYPFPYVPGTPRSWSTSFHQPFTSLSPTTSNQVSNDQSTPRKGSVDTRSGGSTPAMHPAFLQFGFGTDFGPEDPQYPTPNLYDLILQLNSEPGLEQWWAAVTNILHDHFHAERATLIQPVDPTDIENVPWGQKATFSMNGREDFVPQSAVSEVARPEFVLREPSTEASHDAGPQKLHPERLRPRIESRHSYAGHGREVRDILGTLNDPPRRARPQGPQRTVTHTPGMTTVGYSPLPTPRFPSSTSIPHATSSDQDFSSIDGGVDAGPYAEVYDTLRALDHENHPLIEPPGISRVLERGRTVTVTRDYASTNMNSSSPQSTAESTPSQNAASFFGNYRSVFAPDNEPSLRKDYEEYEQHPVSPWQQSPAPSPAIQTDEDTNPFFSPDDTQVDDAFQPATSPKDYAQYDQIEAIGVDRANTVIHVPLVHPTWSQPMQSLRMTPRSKDGPRNLQRSNTVDQDRMAPIAIISILSPATPYPSNLAQCLSLLGPHLATSFAIAQQFSSTHMQPVTIRHRRTASGRQVRMAPMTIEPASLEDIAHAEIEQPPGSVSGSMTSPSDYSGRSKASPSGSIVGTPGWDPASHGWTQSRSIAGTPAVTGSDLVDNYFEIKKHRSGQRSGSMASNTNTPAKPKKTASGESKHSADDELKPFSNDRRSKGSANSKEDKTPLQIIARDRSPSAAGEGPSPSRSRPSMPQLPDFKESKQHSLLHSYGADLQSSFGGFTPLTSAEARSPGFGAHARKGSFPEDMPPPSERLLRTIIDSVPVQIFTAQPETGMLSWVNSKFLIYRGQEPRQVLGDPWLAIHPQDRREFLPAWQRSLRTNQQLQQKVRLQRFDGSYRWFYVRAAPLKDKRQKVVHWIGTMMDFHEQQLAEMNSARQQETAASEAKYRALANSSPQIVFAVNKVKGVTFCNTQWLHYSGQTEAEALGVGFMEHVHPEDLAKCRLPNFDEGSNKPTNVPTSLPIGPTRTFSQSNASSSGSSETERGQSGSGSEESSSPISTLPQRKLSELASTGILKASRDADGRPSYSTEVRLKSKDSQYRWHLVRVLLADPVLHNDEEETWYGTCTDINDHKTLERDLKETMDEKSRFLSNMSHEIRTPLNGITGMVNFLIDSSLTAEQMEHVNIIRASTEGLRGLINDILDLSKAEAGMIQLSMDWLYVRALIEEVNDLTSAMAIDKGLELNYIVDEDVPPQIKGDRFRIRQILLNIVGNAIKFTATGEVFLRCSLVIDATELAQNEAFIRFEIVDTGRGFTDKEAEYLFKRFSQIDGSSTRQHGGTGLGLVISRQLAQLHGGDMSAKGVPNQGSTFTFYIKTTVPSQHDQPPPPTPSVSSIPAIPASPGPISTPTATSSLIKFPSAPAPGEAQARPSPKLLAEVTASPSPGDASPSVSSASSDPSVRSAARTSSLRSERSSASSIVPDSSASMKLELPKPGKTDSMDPSPGNDSNTSETSMETIKAQSGAMSPPMFSILVIAPLKYSREATIKHIDQTLPKNLPHTIASRADLEDAKDVLGGKPLTFSHIVVVIQDVDQIVALMDQVFRSASTTTAIVLITDLAQRRRIMDKAPTFNYDQLVTERRLRFVFKPLKPSRFGLIFDPQKEREMSLDRNQDSAQQVAVNQKQVFEELTRRLGNKDKRVLLVEDNRVNQMVILKFLAKVSIKADTVLDGVQCTDKVFAQPHGHYSIILCDLHMPNKDGYQTCKEIRKWEKRNKYPHLPIIALSANVLGDVYQKCAEAGFNSYMTKPVDFKELSAVLMQFMDPVDPGKPHEFMKYKRAHQHGHHAR